MSVGLVTVTAQNEFDVEAILQAAEQGYSVAQYLLGSELLEEAENEDDRRQALVWLKRAAEQGDEDARALLDSEGEVGG